ncbi:putative transcription factor AS2-LOB family [Helianthus debilis subsp. tardiflorus]
MSCHGCRVLRKRCGDTCVLRPCLDWIDSPEAKARATLFVSKFFGRGDLFNFISSVPSHKRNALFQSLLFEAVGRTINPVNGAIGLLSTGNWHLCQAGVRTVLAGGTPAVLMNTSKVPETDESSGVSEATGELSAMVIGNQIPKNLLMTSSSGGDERSFSGVPAMSFRCSDGEERKLLNLLV